MNKKYYHNIIFSIFLILFSFNSHALGGKKPRPNKPDPSPTNPEDPYSYVDPSNIVPGEALEKALFYYDQMKDEIANIEYLTVIDFSQHSGKKRFYLIDMRDGMVESLKTAHGSGSDPDHNGYVNSLSNVPRSKKSSAGLYKTAETYLGKHGYSLRLDGLSSTNSKARSRAIVVHGADYVDESNSSKSGRSWGCPALDRKLSSRVIDQIKGGSLIFAWHPSYN